MASGQWHAGIALAWCSSRQPAVHLGIRLQQAFQVGLLQIEANVILASAFPQELALRLLGCLKCDMQALK